MTRRHKKGFTLSETLITLVIVGIIAAITVPTLITRYQKEQTVTRLKKTYSALAQTTDRAIADNGPIKTWEIGNNSGASSQAFFEKYLKPYLSISKDCGLQTTGDCEFKYSWLNNATPSGSFSSSYYRFYLQDGSLIAILISGNDTNRYVAVYIDINGQKKPNKFGRDIFRFDYYIQYPGYSIHGKLLPNGNSLSASSLLNQTIKDCCNKNAESSAGQSCAAIIMKSGWTIPDGYPW